MAYVPQTLPPSLNAILAVGAPAAGSKAREVVMTEMRDFVQKGRLGLELLERDLNAGDVESVIEMTRTMHLAHIERLNRIELAIGIMPAKQKIATRILRWAPLVTVASVVALAVIDLAGMGGWHHHLWVIPATTLCCWAGIHFSANR
jgi:hypothetical protein